MNVPCKWRLTIMRGLPPRAENAGVLQPFNADAFVYMEHVLDGSLQVLQQLMCLSSSSFGLRSSMCLWLSAEVSRVSTNPEACG